MYLKPKKGLQVMDPEKGDYLPAEGREVSENQYWSRRLIDGEVTKAKAPKRKANQPAEEVK